jgi:hypothetical protein
VCDCALRAVPPPDKREGEEKRSDMDELTKTIATRGDLAHLALFLWASSASGLLVWTLRELARANQRFEDFVKEIAALNQLFKRKG